MDRQYILAVDPGTAQSGWVMLKMDGTLDGHGVCSNREFLEVLKVHWQLGSRCILAVEEIRNMGQIIGVETLRTCVWSGYFLREWSPNAWTWATRQQVKRHHCPEGRPKDPQVRQALIERYGPTKAEAVGLKKTPGPLYGVKSHVWSALAIATYVLDTKKPPDQLP